MAHPGERVYCLFHEILIYDINYFKLYSFELYNT